MQNIINHKNHPSITTYPTNLTGGCINPIRRTSYKKFININSRFRDNYTTTVAGDFYFNLPENIDKVVSMKLSNIAVPKVIYTINPLTGSNNFGIKFYNSVQDGISSLTVEERIILPEGSYSGGEMSNIINHMFNLKSINSNINQYNVFNHIRARFNRHNGRMCFDISWNILRDSYSINNIDLSFNYIEPSSAIDINCNEKISNDLYFCKNYEIYSNVGSNIYKDQLTLGWLLGFRSGYRYNSPLNSIVIPKSNLTNRDIIRFNNMKSRRPTITNVKDNGMRYLERTVDCCQLNGLKNFEENYDISFGYHIESPLLENSNATAPEECGWTYCAESIYDPIGNRYFYISVNDFQNHHNRAFISPMQEETLNDGNILGKFQCDCGNIIANSNPERIYFGPTNISRLHIKLLDEFGRIVDLNNADYSFTLELEILYDL